MKLPKMQDLTGQRFGKLTVLEFDRKHYYQPNNPRSVAYFWKCKCDCGNEISVARSHLVSGKTLSCGCKNRENIVHHGSSRTRLYNIWCGMKRRCYSTKDAGYPNYGGRGIKICDEWLQFEPFQKWSLSNGYNDDLTIDRINVDGNYCPENCRWITMIEQSNNKRDNRYVEYKGKKYTITQLAREIGMNPRVLFYRIDKWGDVIKAVETPLENRNRAVLQYDLDGNFLKRWGSAIAIEKEIGFKHESISKCCRGKQKTHKGFVWEFEEKHE